MGKLARYRAILRHLVEQESAHIPSHDEIEALCVCDEIHDQYQVLHLGWSQTGRIFTVIAHMRLRDGKVWIERDGTAEGLAPRLEQAGIPREDIVLAFHPVWKRPFTEYAVA